MQIEKTVTGLGAGVGAEVNVDLGELKSSLGSLLNALVQTGDAVEELAGEVIGIVREAGIDNIVRLASEGNEEVVQLLGALYMGMQKAAEKGVQDAGELAATIANKLEEAGYTIKSGCGHNCGCKHKH